jgi:hypothetical protein
VTYGGDSGNRTFVLYWRCPLIRVSVIRGSTGYIIKNNCAFVGGMITIIRENARNNTY